MTIEQVDIVGFGIDDYTIKILEAVNNGFTQLDPAHTNSTYPQQMGHTFLVSLFKGVVDKPTKMDENIVNEPAIKAPVGRPKK